LDAQADLPRDLAYAVRGIHQGREPAQNDPIWRRLAAAGLAMYADPQPRRRFVVEMYRWRLTEAARPHLRAELQAS
jgi:hypothetical protein